MNTAENASIWIYTDADNTLWDTNALFSDAQLALLSTAEQIAQRKAAGSDRLGFLRTYDQAIALRHHARLRYPPGLLVRALILGISGLGSDAAATRVVASSSELTSEESRAAEQFSVNIGKLPTLLVGVREGLEAAQSQRVPVYVITEGLLEKARERASELGIDRYLEGILSSTKSIELYRRLAQKASPRRTVMIGDQADRDIHLAHSAGLRTVLVKGAFQPAWISDDHVAGADAIVPDFKAAITWILNSYT